MSKMTNTASQHHSKELDASHAHLIWINFFHDRLNVMKYVGKLELSLFFKIYHVAHMNSKSAR
jgi:hypothetical protein